MSFAHTQLGHPDRPRGESCNLPRPRVQIGDRLDPRAVRACGHLRRHLLREQIRSHRTILAKLRLGGYVKRTAGDAAILSAHCKGLIRETMQVLDTCYEVEVAGIVAAHGYPGVANQDFVGGVHAAHGGVTFHCQLLFRALVDGNHVSFVQDPISASHYTMSDYVAERIVLDEHDGPSPFERGRRERLESHMTSCLYANGSEEAAEWQRGVSAAETEMAAAEKARFARLIEDVIAERRAAGASGGRKDCPA